MNVSDIKHEVIRNPKILVIGASPEEMVQIKILLASKNIDLVELPREADAVVDANWVYEKNNNEVDALPSTLDSPTDVTCQDYDDGKQHWRGGKRGRKGKIKYERR